MDTSEVEGGLAGVAGYKQRMRELRINKELRKIKKKLSWISRLKMGWAEDGLNEPDGS